MEKKNKGPRNTITSPYFYEIKDLKPKLGASVQMFS